MTTNNSSNSTLENALQATGVSKIGRKYTVAPDRKDPRDVMFMGATTGAMNLPASVDLRGQNMPDVVDQGQLGSCTANAIVSGLREYLELKNNEEFVALSRLFLYWHEREMEGTIDEDSGAMIRDGMKVLNKMGVCPETDYPYDIPNFKDKPSPRAEDDAKKYRIGEYHRVMNLTLLKAALSSGLPVVVGFKVYESFESEEVAATGLVPVPDTTKENLLGGHAVLAVGYDDEKQIVVIRNSWGANWADQGYCYFPYELFKNGVVMDMWTGH